MHIRRLCLAAALAATALAALPAAAAQRTYVASTGLDTNACSLAAPCRSFARALTQTDENGEILVLDSAGYGPVTIRQSVSIIAPDGVYAGISVISGTATRHGVFIDDTLLGNEVSVTLRGLAINGVGPFTGIGILVGGTRNHAVFIERCSVATMGEAGIYVDTPSRVVISDTTIRRTLSGPAFQVAEEGASVDLLRSRIEGNAGGVRVEPVLGAAVTTPTSLLISDSVIARNFSTGVRISPFDTDGVIRTIVTRTVIEDNADHGIYAQAVGSLVVTDSLVTGAPSMGIVTGTAGTWDVTIARNTIEGSGGPGITISTAATGTYRALIADNIVRGNGGDGIGLFNGSLTATALVSDNRLVGNSGNGLFCGSVPGTTLLLVAEGNEVVGNGRAFEQGAGCTFESAGNNMARGNTNPDAGTITTVPLR